MSLTPDPADPFVIGLGGRESEIGQERENVRGLEGEHSSACDCFSEGL